MDTLTYCEECGTETTDTRDSWERMAGVLILCTPCQENDPRIGQSEEGGNNW